MPFTPEQDSFILMAHFRSAALKPDGNWSYSLQSCIEQFVQQYPNENIHYDLFSQRKCTLVRRFEAKNCVCKGKSTGRPTVLTETVVADIRERMEQSPKKSIAQLSVQTGLSLGTCRKALRKNLDICSNKLPEDAENWIRYTLCGGRIILKEGVIPHFFNCQLDSDTPINPERSTNSQYLEFVEDGTATTSAGQIRENPDKTSVSTRKINTPDTCMLSDTSSCSEVEPRIKRRISSSSTEQTVNNFQTISNDYTSDDEFDLFCKSLACQLKKMPLDRALICQEKLQSVMTEERLYQIGASRSEQQSEAARYEIVVKEEDLETTEPDEYKVIVKEETDIDIDDEFV